MSGIGTPRWLVAALLALAMHAGGAMLLLHRPQSAGAAGAVSGEVAVRLGPSSEASGLAAGAGGVAARSGVPAAPQSQAPPAVPPRAVTGAPPRAVTGAPPRAVTGTESHPAIAAAGLATVTAGPLPRRRPPLPANQSRTEPAGSGPQQPAAGPPTDAPGAAAGVVGPDARHGDRVATGARTTSAGHPGGPREPGAEADFILRLQAWLGRHQHYPDRARVRRQQGTAMLFFAMDRNGRVLAHRVQQSSGHPLLDREAEAMLERAQPLPKPPPSWRQSRLELVVPVQFVLR